MTHALQRAVAVAGTLAVIAFAAPVQAGQGGAMCMSKGQCQCGGQKGGHGGHHGLMGKAMDRLDLTRAQADKLTAIRKDVAQRHITMKVELRSLRWRLKHAAAAEDPNAEKVGGLYLQIQDKQRALKQDRQQVRERMLAVLTEEQRAKMPPMMGDGQCSKGKGKHKH